MIHLLSVDAAHWWGPLGWLYKAVPGNLAADALTFVAGFLAGRIPWKRHRAAQAKLQASHDDLHAKVDALHEKLG